MSDLKRVRIIYVRGRGWYWYILPKYNHNSYQCHGPFETYELAKKEAGYGR